MGSLSINTEPVTGTLTLICDQMHILARWLAWVPMQRCQLFPSQNTRQTYEQRLPCLTDPLGESTVGEDAVVGTSGHVCSSTQEQRGKELTDQERPRSGKWARLPLYLISPGRVFLLQQPARENRQQKTNRDPHSSCSGGGFKSQSQA